ncbi:amidase [Marinobacter halodurans]|uniref:Amidase n=1 Tax=Marinobacter halodurans TaxID=2528979 RepID=A0ABY1ZNP1_9GAMM|nr:amidase [Marinobacter halodurans]TBW57954.1 amidase [Marinobacter halodurans]
MTAQERPTPIHAFTDDALGKHDATALAALIRRGDISAREAVNAAIQRAQAVEPQLHGIATPDYENARRQAACTGNGVFAGVPTLIKDNTDVRGLPTGHGSLAVRSGPASHTNAFAQQFLAQGLISIGKSTLPEFGFNASTEPAHTEATRNPWNPAYSSGASSGGSAALVAAGVVPIAHANDGGGSIRIPAACCGLVGLKPTRGRLVDGEAARALPINIIGEGVVTRTVRDTANFLAGAERYHQNRRLPPVGEVLGPGKRRLRIGLVLDSVTGEATDPQTRQAVEATARLLAGQGHAVMPVDVPVAASFADDFAHYWSSLAFLMTRFGHRILDRNFQPEHVDGLTRGLADRFRRQLHRAPGVLWRLYRSRKQYAEGLERMGVDVVLSPALAHTTPKLGYLSPDQPFETLFARLRRYVAFTPLANASGAPAISLPGGRTADNLPIAVHLSARHGGERDLLELAFELEAVAPWPSLATAESPIRSQLDKPA